MKPTGGTIIFSLTIGGALLLWYVLGPLFGLGLALVIRGIAEVVWMQLYRRWTKADQAMLQAAILAAVKAATEEATKKAVTEYMKQVLGGRQIITMPPDPEKGH